MALGIRPRYTNAHGHGYGSGGPHRGHMASCRSRLAARLDEPAQPGPPAGSPRPDFGAAEAGDGAFQP